MMPFPPTDWSSSPSLTARKSLLLVSVNCLVCVSVCVHAFPPPPPPFLRVCSSRAARVFVFSWPLLFLACFVRVSNLASCIHSTDRARLLHI
jgi:hypothetical protein